MIAATLASIGLAAAWLAGCVVLDRLPDWRLRLPLGAGSGFVALSLVAILLAEQGALTPVTLAVAGMAFLAVAILARGRARAKVTDASTAPPTPASSGRLAAGIAALALAGLVFVAGRPVIDTRLEASDPGIYALTAARLDATGGIAYEDPLVADMSAENRARFFPDSALSTSRSMGFYLDDPESGRVVPQFLPLAPVWMVVARWLTGPGGASWAGLAALWLSALVLFGLVRRDAGTPAAAFAAVLLAINFVAVWFARYSAAEPFALVLVVIGVTAYLAMYERDDPRLGLLAGLALGLAWIAKLELLLLLFPLAGLFLLDLLGGALGRRAHRAFWVGVAIAGALFFWHAWGWARPYVHDVLLVPGLDLATVTAVAASGGAIAIGLFAAARRHDFARWSRLPDRVPTPAVWAALVAIALAVAYGLAVRPQTPSWDSHNMLMLAWMLEPVGLALACWGLAVVLLRRPGGGVERMLFVLLVVGSLVLWRKQIRPHLLWSYRRYLPVLLPGALWLAGVGLGDLLAAFRRTLREPAAGLLAPLRAAALGVLVAVATLAPLGGAWSANRFYAGFADLHGSERLIRELGRLVPAAALVVVEPRTRRGLLRLEGALQHELGRTVLRMRSPDLAAPELHAALVTQWRRGNRTYLLTSGHVVVPPPTGLVPIEEVELETSRLLETDHVLPSVTEQLVIRARLYEILPAGSVPPLAGRLDVGSWDDAYLEGPTFHEVEREGDRDYRWTTAAARVRLPGLSSTDELLLVRLASAYPPERGIQEVIVSLDGRELARFPVRRGWRDYEVPLDGVELPDSAWPVLEIRAEPTLALAETLDVEDPRHVGVAVDLVRWGPRPR